jgi:hypothetical protein
MTGAEKGAIFVATGAGYVRLARRAAATLRETNRDLPVDLYTDAPLQETLFDQVHVLERPWFRSKLDAMAASRFDRTLYLDSDLMVLADIGDVFELLDHFDIAMAQEQFRNGATPNTVWRRDLPAAFPQYNSGVVAFRRSPAVLDLLGRWSEAVRVNELRRDQPALRELLFDSALRIATLPPEYNLMDYQAVSTWGPYHAAPRIVHHYRFHNHFTAGTGRRTETLLDLAGPDIAARLPGLLASDRMLAARRGETPAPQEPAWRRRRRAAALALPHYGGRAVSKLRRLIAARLGRRRGPEG